MTHLLIIPAIDLHNGEAVRLYKGDFAQKTVYSKNPVALARKFQRMGAEYLHIVDLDGAKRGNAVNAKIIREISENAGIPLQVGGGIRSLETVALYLDELEIDRIILGTIAVEDIGFVAECVDRYSPNRIMVGVDIKDGRVATDGWRTDSGADCFAFIEDIKSVGVEYIVVTDIVRDGTLTSPNWALYEQISGINVIVSGGVACEDDLQKASKYYGVIVGKAYYEGKLDLAKWLKKE